MNPQMMQQLMAALQGGGGAPQGGPPMGLPQPGPPMVGGGPPQATMGPPAATPPALPQEAGTQAAPLNAVLPTRSGDMWNPAMPSMGDQGDQQRMTMGNSLPNFARTPLGALLIPNLIHGVGGG